MKWITAKLGDVADFLSGGTPNTQKQEYWGGNIPWVSAKDLKGSRIYDSELTITEMGAENGSRIVPAGTILFVVRGMSLASEFRISLSKVSVAFNQDLKALRLKTDIDNVFLFYALFSQRDKIRQLAGEASHGTKKLPTEVIQGIQIRIPEDKASQKKIADIIEAYDNLIENNRHRIDLLEQSARMLYKEWFVSLRFPGHEHVSVMDGVPEGWEKGVLSDFFDTTSGGTPSRSKPEYYLGDINWVKTQELNENFIFDTEEKITEEAISKSSAKLFPESTLLVSIYGGTNIGRTGILAHPSTCNQACVALFPAHQSANPYFAQLFLQNVRDNLIGMSQGAAQTNISQQVLRQIEMVMPDPQSMRVFLEYLSPLYEQKKILEKQTTKLHQARDLLLPRLMNGELPV